MDGQIHDSDEAASGWCGEWATLLMLFAAGEELDPAEEANVAEHLAHCGHCRETLERERALLGGLGQNRVEPDVALLASCRANLRDALDREEERGWWRRRIGALVPTNWMSPRPAWSAALLLLFGFSAGIFGPRLLEHHPQPVAQNNPPPSSVSPALSPDGDTLQTNQGGNSPLTALDLHTANVSGINVIPAGTGEPPEVQLQLNQQQPVMVQGTVDNNDVKRLLMYVLDNSNRFDPDVRINAVDLLRAKTNDPDVRSVLCHAAHTDRNTAVRLKALEALDGAEPQELVRQTLLDALNDRNPGVRIEAINALQSMAAKGEVVSDEHMLSVLRDRMLNDPNTYIRMQSAAVFRDLGPRQKF
ncbi:MAG TPA: HEAT repeat domain-containing protein [Candidatus Acidoferrum sp.]|nr:HEAT repeat domain-containing protein [Candidatus Acidoferrum sp.]